MNNTATPASHVPPSVSASTEAPLGAATSSASSASELVPLIATAVAFAVLFFQPLRSLIGDWWTMPEAGHGLLLGPMAVWLAWKAGLTSEKKPALIAGVVILLAAVMFRFAAGLAAELFIMRGSMVIAIVGLIVFSLGWSQVAKWWLPILLICLSIPLPELLTQAIALPLQFKASQMGAALLEMRQIPVRLNGNVIRIPGQELFVTEACSGLRSLTALLSTAVLIGALTFRHPFTRVLLVAIAVPIAILINGVRVFLTGFLVYFVSPELGKGFMHVTEGWLLFLVSLLCIGAMAWLALIIERRVMRKEADV
jgi:exosortase